MNTTIYLIIGGVAIIFAAYIYILYNYSKKRKKEQLTTFMSTHSNKELTQKQKHALAFSAILAYHRMEKILDFIPQGNLDEYRLGLKQQWGITNKEEAENVLNKLCSLQNSKQLDNNLNKFYKLKETIAKELKLSPASIDKVQSTYAWDLCRASSLAKWAYWCGYITEEEAWNYIYKVVDIAHTVGKDWMEYTVSFLLGRTIQGFDLDDVIIEADEILNSKKIFVKKNNGIDLYKEYDF